MVIVGLNRVKTISVRGGRFKQEHNKMNGSVGVGGDVGKQRTESAKRSGNVMKAIFVTYILKLMRGV
jgi:hypothetical protein